MHAAIDLNGTLPSWLCGFSTHTCLRFREYNVCRVQPSHCRAGAAAYVLTICIRLKFVVKCAWVCKRITAAAFKRDNRGVVVRPLYSDTFAFYQV